MLFSRAQLLAWMMSLLLLPVLLSLFAPLFAPFSVYALLFFYALITIQVLLLTIYDPAPVAVRKIRAGGQKPPPYSGSTRHAIRNGFCTLCKVNVKAGTKHCKRCNKCIENFDHHCIWLNNCIGGKNYRLFIVLIICMAVILTTIIAFLVVVAALTFINSPLISVEDGMLDITLLRVPVALWAIGCVFVTLFLSICDGLVIHLIVFHIRIRLRGETTYAFITRERRSLPTSNSVSLNNHPTTETMTTVEDRSVGTEAGVGVLSRATVHSATINWTTHRRESPTQSPLIILLFPSR